MISPLVFFSTSVIAAAMRSTSILSIILEPSPAPRRASAPGRAATAREPSATCAEAASETTTAEDAPAETTSRGDEPGAVAGAMVARCIRADARPEQEEQHEH